MYIVLLPMIRWRLIEESEIGTGRNEMSRHILSLVIWAVGLALVWADPILAKSLEPQKPRAESGEPDRLPAGAVLQAWNCPHCTIPVCISVRALDGDLHLLLYRPKALPSILTAGTGGDLRFCQPDMRRIEIACISQDTCNYTFEIQEFKDFDPKGIGRPINWPPAPLVPRY